MLPKRKPLLVKLNKEKANKRIEHKQNRRSSSEHLFCLWLEYNNTRCCIINIPTVSGAQQEITEIQRRFCIVFPPSGLLFKFILMGISCVISTQSGTVFSVCLEADFKRD